MEAELRHEVDKLRSAKKALEGKLAGVDVARLAEEVWRVKYKV